jgi:hypothetical protein
MAISEFLVFLLMLASPLFPASLLLEIATLPFPQAANGEKPYRANHPRRMDIPTTRRYASNQNTSRASRRR